MGGTRNDEASLTEATDNTKNGIQESQFPGPPPNSYIMLLLGTETRILINLCEIWDPQTLIFAVLLKENSYSYMPWKLASERIWDFV